VGQAAIALGGSPLAEHGVGRNPVKKRLLEELHGRRVVDQFRQIKAILDPTGKLAPGVLL
jgi:D-lactate dehydrogenase (cytochrome)